MQVYFFRVMGSCEIKTQPRPTPHETLGGSPPVPSDCQWLAVLGVYWLLGVGSRSVLLIAGSATALCMCAPLPISYVALGPAKVSFS